MKQYTDIEQMTIHNEGNALIQEFITNHISAYDIEQILDPNLPKKLKVLNDILQLEIYHNIAIGCVCNYTLGQVVYRTRKSIVRAFKEHLLNPAFIT